MQTHSDTVPVNNVAVGVGFTSSTSSDEHSVNIIKSDD